MFAMGQKVKCKISGLAGTVTGVANYDTGAVDVRLALPLDKDGNFREDRWFAEQRLEPLEG
jgi:hypothetical protein